MKGLTLITCSANLFTLTSQDVQMQTKESLEQITSLHVIGT